MRSRSYLLIMVLLASIGRLFVPSAVGAVDSKGLNLITSPVPINLIADPGKTVTTDLRIKQSDPEPARLKVSLMKFGAYGEAGMPALRDREAGDDYFDWVKFDRPVFTAPPNEWQTIKMTIKLPKSAAFGYYYAVVFTREGDDLKKGANITSLNGGTAILVLLEARSPNAKRMVTIESFSVKHRVVEFLPTEFNLKLFNRGNVHVVPFGNVFLMRGKKEVGRLLVNDAKGNILPGSKRIYGAEWLDGFPHIDVVTENGTTKTDKKGKPLQHWVWANGGAGARSAVPHLRIGKYTAHLFAVYDDGRRDVPIEATLDFWVIPWRFLLVALLVVGLLGFAIYALVRNTMRGVQRLRRPGRRR